jgi:inner membrane protein
VLASPIPTRVPTDDGRRAAVRRDWRYLLPADLDVSADVAPVERHSGIYRVQAYTAAIEVTAAFAPDSLREALAAPEGSTVAANDVRLLVPVCDLRGIREIAAIGWNGQRLEVSPAVDGLIRGISAPLSLAPTARAESTFILRGTIAGTGSLSVLPFGRTTRVRMHSSWPHPSFRGAFLPAHYTLDRSGFSADWQVLEVNRDYPQTWEGRAVPGAMLEKSAFGVSLYAPVDVYQRDYRAIRYAVLFIALTFMCLFLWEQVARQRLHAMQYLLIGLALATFYLLLIALSEHVGFGLAYGLAAAGEVGVLAVYLVGAMRARLAGSLAAAGIAVVYGALYLLILSEQYALLLGSLLLFVVLAAILVVTRRVDWYRKTTEMASGPSA